MASKRNTQKPPDIRSILAAKNFNKPKFSKDEKAVILNAQRKVFDKVVKQDLDDFAKNTVKPWVEEFALLEKIKKSNKDKGSQLESDIKGVLYPPSPTASQSTVPEILLRHTSPAAFADLASGNCTGIWILEPPYDEGDPEVEVRTPTDPPGPSASDSALVIPAEGAISLAVGAGNLAQLDANVAPYDWFFGKYNMVEGSLMHTVLLPSPLVYPTRVTVTPEFKLGVDWPHKPGVFALLPSNLGDGATLVQGTSLLTLYGNPAVNSGNSKSMKFLYQWRSRRSGCYETGECVNPKTFSNTASLDLLPGATAFTIVISVRIKALLTLVPGGGLRGFAGADFRKPGVGGVWFLSSSPGGAIRVPKIKMSFCRVGLVLDL